MTYSLLQTTRTEGTPSGLCTEREILAQCEADDSGDALFTLAIATGHDSLDLDGPWIPMDDGRMCQIESDDRLYLHESD